MKSVRKMRWVVFGICCLALASMLWVQQRASMLWAQQRTDTRGAGNNRQTDNNDEEKEKEEVKLPDDKRLLDVHKKFVLGAQKLAMEYERDNQLEKARACFEEVLRLIPNYPDAVAGLERIQGKINSAEKKTLDIMANKSWQDTGVVVAAGKPIHISADGVWTFRMALDLTADGIAIPEEWKEFNLGCLIGIIDDGSASTSNTNSPPTTRREHRDRDREKHKEPKPFLVGSQCDFTPEKTGRLLLQMYDVDTTDNQGKLNVTITGTFYHPKK